MAKRKGNPNIKDHGFAANPDNINKTGANKGSKWKSTLLKDLMTIDLSESETESFKDFAEKFPKIFDSSEEKNFQLFMEMKQISLVFHKSATISQNAINAIKDRIDGKPQQYVDHTSDGEAIVWNEEKTYEANEETDISS